MLTQQLYCFRWAEELVQQYVKANNTVGLGTGVLVNNGNSYRTVSLTCKVSADFLLCYGRQINSIIEHLARQANAGLLKAGEHHFKKPQAMFALMSCTLGTNLVLVAARPV